MENEGDSDFLADDKFNACSKVDMEIVVVSLKFNLGISIYSITSPFNFAAECYDWHIFGLRTLHTLPRI